MGSEMAKTPGWGGNGKPDPRGTEPFQVQPLSQLWVLGSRKQRASRFLRRPDHVATSVPTPAGCPAESRDR